MQDEKHFCDKFIIRHCTFQPILRNIENPSPLPRYSFRSPDVALFLKGAMANFNFLSNRESCSPLQPLNSGAKKSVFPLPIRSYISAKIRCCVPTILSDPGVALSGVMCHISLREEAPNVIRVLAGVWISKIIVLNGDILTLLRTGRCSMRKIWFLNWRESSLYLSTLREIVRKDEIMVHNVPDFLPLFLIHPLVAQLLHCPLPVQVLSYSDIWTREN